MAAAHLFVLLQSVSQVTDRSPAHKSSLVNPVGRGTGALCVHSAPDQASLAQRYPSLHNVKLSFSQPCISVFAVFG